MPTLLHFCGIEIPDTVEGLESAGRAAAQLALWRDQRRAQGTRMIHDGRHKLIYYPYGNRIQLFDLAEDPNEERDISGSPAYADVQRRLEGLLMDSLYGPDRAWIADGHLCGVPAPEYTEKPGLRLLQPERTSLAGHAAHCALTTRDE